MKYLLLTLFAVTFVGHVSAICNHWGTMECIKNETFCPSAASCQMDSYSCGQSEECYSQTPSCRQTVSTLKRCSTKHRCPNAFEFKQAVEDKCFMYFSGGESLFASFAAIIVCFLAYFTIEI